jgi:hypothetical protein
MAVLLGLAGCSVPRALRPQPDPMEIPPPVASANDLRARLGAASQITSVNLRDQTLAALALEAANSSLPELIREALLGINAMNLRDNVAADCALRLGRQGREGAGCGQRQGDGEQPSRPRCFFHRLPGLNATS